MTKLAVLVATYRRPDSLAALLERLRTTANDVPDDVSVHVVVVDNDPAQSAREVVASAGAHADVRYGAEERPGIAAARNALLEESSDVDFVVFVDDDELPEDGWLRELIATQRRLDADVVAGPVVYRFAREPGRFVARASCFRTPSRASGAPVRYVATNNVLVRRSAIPSGVRFDDRLGIVGGSDTLFFMNLRAAGATAVWSPDAIVTTVVPADRATVRWVLRRYVRLGTASTIYDRLLGVRQWRARRLAIAALWFLRGVAGVVAGSATLRAGRCVDGICDLARSGGMASAAIGLEFSEYRR